MERRDQYSWTLLFVYGEVSLLLGILQVGEKVCGQYSWTLVVALGEVSKVYF